MRRTLLGLVLVAVVATPAQAEDCWTVDLDYDGSYYVADVQGRSETVNFEVVGSFLWVAPESDLEDITYYDLGEGTVDYAVVCDGSVELAPVTTPTVAPSVPSEVDVWEATAPVAVPYVEPLFGPR